MRRCESGCGGNSNEPLCFVRRQGIESVAEQLSASWEEFFSLTLIVIRCNDLGIYNVQIVQSSYSTISFDESV